VRYSARMKGWLKVAWHDPVGSKVIAGIILGALGGVVALLGVLWSKSDFSTNASVAWTAAKHALLAYTNWVNAPASMSRGTVFIIVCVAFIVPCLALIAVVRRMLGDVVKLPVEEMVSVQPRLPLPSELSEVQRRALSIIYREYPRYVAVEMLRGPLGLLHAATEQMCEQLAELKLVQLTPVGDQVFLTKIGRNYCIEHGQDKSFASSAAVAPATEPPPAASELSGMQRHLFFILYREYPKAIDIRIVASPLGLPYPEAKRMCEQLARTDLIALVAGPANGPSVYLTQVGRLYVLQHALNHQQ
jgi:hypothetical protein